MKRIVWGAVIAGGLVSMPAAAQVTVAPARAPRAEDGTHGAQASGSAPAPRRITVSAGLDVPTAYYFRGIRQEDRGAIPQPYVDVGVPLGAVEMHLGTWNSLHSGPTGSTGPGGAWYESDLYASLTAGVGPWRPGVQFTTYTSPNAAYRAVYELAAVLAYDDGGHTVAWSPKVLLATEVGTAQADGGTGRGSYLELSVAPALTIPSSPVQLRLPLKVGLSVRRYYESGGRDNRFGYAEAGAVAGMPLSRLRPGAWEVHAGLSVLYFGAGRRLPGRDGTLQACRPVLHAGVGVTF